MKKSVIIILFFISLLSLQALASNAIECSYEAHGAIQKISFVAHPDVHLEHFTGNEVLLRVNGGKEVMNFKVHETYTHVGSIKTFSFRNPFFVSNIVITHVKDLSDEDTLTGTWATDYPPVLQLSCQFIEAN